MVWAGLNVTLDQSPFPERKPFGLTTDGGGYFRAAIPWPTISCIGHRAELTLSRTGIIASLVRYNRLR